MLKEVHSTVSLAAPSGDGTIGRGTRSPVYLLESMPPKMTSPVARATRSSAWDQRRRIQRQLTITVKIEAVGIRRDISLFNQKLKDAGVFGNIRSLTGWKANT